MILLIGTKSKGAKKAWISFLVSMLLVIIAGLLILGGVSKLHAEVKDKGGEAGCKLFNMLRAKASTEVSGLKVGLPRACKTIHLSGKNEVPKEEYGEGEEGIKNNIRDLVVRCWDMWLKGKEPNMFQRFYGFADGGMICYTFPIKRDSLPAGQRVTKAEFDDFLGQPYVGIDKTDRCNAGGEGGRCAVGEPNNRNACLSISGGADAFARNIGRSERCSPNEVCCIASSNEDECKNKGGMCLGDASGGYTRQFTGWKCADSGLRCFLRPQDVVTTFDYIQGTGGSDTGPGAITYKVSSGENVNDFSFRSRERYAISFVSPGKDTDLGTLIGAGGLLFGGYVAIKTVQVLSGPVGWATLAIEAAAGGGIVYNTLRTGSLNDINYLVISKYSAVEGVYMEETELSTT